MSHYDWESGTITLPAHEVAPTKAALRDAANKLHAEVLAEAKRLHTQVAKGTTSITLHHERIRAHVYSQQNRSSFGRDAVVSELAVQVLDTIRWARKREGKAMRGPQLIDLKHVAPKVGNRDTEFHLDVGGTISFDGRKVHYESSDNNRQVERARDSVLGRVFFAQLGKIVFTRGTGGALIGNDEYNRDSDSIGGGGSYITATYGPVGHDARVDQYISRGFSRKDATRMAAAGVQPANRHGR